MTDAVENRLKTTSLELGSEVDIPLTEEERMAKFESAVQFFSEKGTQDPVLDPDS